MDDSAAESLDESMLDVIQRAEAFIMAHSYLNREAERSSSNIFDVSGGGDGTDDSFHSAAGGDKSTSGSSSANDSGLNMLASAAAAVGASTSGTSSSNGHSDEVPEPTTTDAPSDRVEVLSDDSNATLPYELDHSPPQANATNAAEDCSADNDDCVVIEVQNPVVDLCSSMYDNDDETPLSPATRRARRRRADAAPVVDSITLDDTVNDIPSPAHRNSAAAMPLPPKRINVTVPSQDSTPKPASVSATCPICLESIFHQQAASTICGHLFCNACIQQEIRIRKKCPMCKRVLKRQHVHPIYFN